MVRPPVLELRGGVRAAAPSGRTEHARTVARFLPDPRARDADPGYIRDRALAEEAAGFDSVLVTAYSAWPDPWLVAGWALAATRRLRAVVAHRPGTTAPTVAARALATLDRLSQGRASAHIVIGSSDADVRRDGDFALKAERYRRAREYLEIFTRTLTDPDPFDYEGEFYAVRDAWSGLRSHQRPAPPLSFGGSSPQGQALAAEFADVYGLSHTTPEQTRETVARMEQLAAEHGRRLRYWRHLRLLLGESDAEASERAEEIAATAAAAIEQRPPAELVASAQLARDAERDAAYAGDPRAAARRQLAAGVESTIVGSPQTAARRVLEFHRAGVDVLQLDAPVESRRDQALRKRLVRLVRQGAQAA